MKGFGGKFGVQVDRVDQVNDLIVFVYLELTSLTARVGSSA